MALPGRHVDRVSALPPFAWLPALGWLAALLCCAVHAGAQTVVGHVIEEGSGRPLIGAFVVLEDDAGARRWGVLTDSAGAFTLRAGAAGRYRLAAELIGHATTRTEPFELRARATVRATLEVPVQAVSLEGIQVETGARCRPRPGSGPATARVWDEARKALEVADWSRRQGVLRFYVVEHRQELDSRLRRVAKRELRGRDGFYDRSPYRSVPATRLERIGYIEEAADGSRNYYAPDAEVLLSESFLSTHCFRVVESDPEPGERRRLLGLAFEPVPGRALADIEGVLWLDRATGELQRLEFRYVNVPGPFRDWRQVGGRVEFERLGTGMWIVRRWWIRMPLRARATGGYGGGDPELALETLVEEGAEVRRVETRDGRVLERWRSDALP